MTTQRPHQSHSSNFSKDSKASVGDANHSWWCYHTLANWDSATAWNSYNSQDPGRAFTDIRRQRTLTFFRRQQAEVDGRGSSQLDCLNSALSDLVSCGLFINDYAQKSLAKKWSFIHQRNKTPHDCGNLGLGILILSDNTHNCLHRAFCDSRLTEGSLAAVPRELGSKWCWAE